MRARSLILAAAMATGLSASMGNAMAPRMAAVTHNGAVQLINGSPAPTPFIGVGGSIGKGKGKRPHHASGRFVAADKRDARKRRNGGKAPRIAHGGGGSRSKYVPKVCFAQGHY